MTIGAGALREACLVLLAAATGALLLAGRLPPPGPVRSRLYPLTVAFASLACLSLTVGLAVRFDPQAAVSLGVAGVFLGLAGKRRHALLASERDRMLRRLRANTARARRR